MFFWLDPKNQERNDIQPVSFLSPRYAGQALIKLWYYCGFDYWALMTDSKSVNYCYFTYCVICQYSFLSLGNLCKAIDETRAGQASFNPGI